METPSSWHVDRWMSCFIGAVAALVHRQVAKRGLVRSSGATEGGKLVRRIDISRGSSDYCIGSGGGRISTLAKGAPGKPFPHGP